MKNNLRRLNAIMKLFPENSFYTVAATEYGVSCQGRYNANTVLLARKLKFTFSISESGYTDGKRGYYNICLTD